MKRIYGERKYIEGIREFKECKKEDRRI